MEHINVTWTQVPRDVLELYGIIMLAIDIIAISKYCSLSLIKG